LPFEAGSFFPYSIAAFKRWSAGVGSTRELVSVLTTSVVLHADMLSGNVRASREMPMKIMKTCGT
jgi:hypothetical protein